MTQLKINGKLNPDRRAELLHIKELREAAKAKARREAQIEFKKQKESLSAFPPYLGYIPSEASRKENVARHKQAARKLEHEQRATLGFAVRELARTMLFWRP